MATGWFFSDNSFSVEPDFQQQAVIDYFVDEILKCGTEANSMKE